MTAPLPRVIRRLDDPRAPGAIEIVWADGATSAYTPRLLRSACPCATCREKRVEPTQPNPLAVLAPEEIAPLSITGMQPVGQYAYSIEFSDGHSSGIYTLDYLRELGG